MGPMATRKPSKLPKKKLQKKKAPPRKKATPKTKPRAAAKARLPVKVQVPDFLRAGEQVALTLSSVKPLTLDELEIAWSSEVWEVVRNRFVTRDEVHHEQRVRGPVVLPPRTAVTVALPDADYDTLAGRKLHDTFGAGNTSVPASLDRDLDAALPQIHLPPVSLLVWARVGKTWFTLGRAVLQVLPPLAAPLLPEPRVEPDALIARLAGLEAKWGFAVLGDTRWFIFFTTGDGKVVGEAELLAVAAMRDTLVGRTLTNEKLPRVGMFPAQPGEDVKATRVGGVSVARAWTKALVEPHAELSLLPWLVSNTTAALSGLRLAAGGQTTTAPVRDARQGLWSQLSVGQVFHVELGDHDALDSHAFHVESLDGGLTLSWQPVGGERTTLRYSMVAIDQAHALTEVSQGSVNLAPDDEVGFINRTAPPFMLSRALFKELSTQGELSLHLEVTGRTEQLNVTGRARAELRLEGRAMQVNTLRVVGEHGLSLEVVDDASLPLLLSIVDGAPRLTFSKIAR